MATSPPAADVTPAPAAQQLARRTALSLPTLADVQQVIVAALDGLRRELNTLWHNLTRAFGLGQVHTPRPPAQPPEDTDVIHGNLKNQDFWQASPTRIANLAVVAMVVGQLTGTMPNFDAIVEEATDTDSVDREALDPVTGNGTGKPRKMYLGADTNDWVWSNDAAQLMENHGVLPKGSFYNSADGDTALANVIAALDQKKAVVALISSPAPNFTGNVVRLVVIVAVDDTTNEVIVNDAALGADGKGKVMLKADFMQAWKPKFYEMMVVEQAPSAQISGARADDFALAA